MILLLLSFYSTSCKQTRFKSLTRADPNFLHQSPELKCTLRRNWKTLACPRKTKVATIQWSCSRTLSVQRTPENVCGCLDFGLHFIYLSSRNPSWNLFLLPSPFLSSHSFIFFHPLFNVSHSYTFLQWTPQNHMEVYISLSLCLGFLVFFHCFFSFYFGWDCHWILHLLLLISSW